MEGEGSGYDLVYEKLSLDAKPFPELESSFSSLSVTIRSGIIDEEALTVIDYINKHFQLTQKETITLGLVATRKKLLSTQLSVALQLNHEDKLRYWLGSLCISPLIDWTEILPLATKNGKLQFTKNIIQLIC